MEPLISAGFNGYNGVVDKRISGEAIVLKKPIIYLLAALLTSCASNVDRLSLFNAIEESAQKIAAELPAEGRVAIVSFKAENKNLSDFVINELTTALIANGLEVADRQNLDFVKRELNFDSGNINDERAAAIGRFLGAQFVITGQLNRVGAESAGILSALPFIGHRRDTDSAYLCQLNAIHVEQRLTNITRFALNDGPQLTRPPAFIQVRSPIHGSAGSYLDRGILFLERGDFFLAMLDFNEAILRDPGFTAAFQWRGTMHLDNGNLDHAIADFSRVIRLDPGFAAAFNNRGVAHRMRGSMDDAIADFNQAIRLDPNFAPALHARGNTYFDRGNYERAIADYNLAIRFDPNFALAFNNRGVAHRRLGNLDSAIADFNQAIRLDPNLTEAYKNRSDVHRITGNLIDAIADLNQAIRLNPNLIWVFNTLGILHFETGNYDHAIADFETVLQLEPDNDNVRLWLEEARRRRALYETVIN